MKAKQYLTPQAEAVIKCMSVTAVEPSATAPSTKKGGVNRIEANGQMANLDRARFLALAFWGGFARQEDKPELKGYLMRDVIHKSDWFKVQRYLADMSYRRKIDSLIYTAILNISAEELLPSSFIAEQMGITKRNYNKTWPERYQMVIDQLDNWVIEAAHKINKNVRGLH